MSNVTKLAKPDPAWVGARLGEADRAGVAAARVRAVMVDAAEGNNPELLRAASTAYGVLIDRAERLTAAHVTDGEATPLDHLHERRARREANTAGRNRTD